MKLIFISNAMTPHQKPLCDAFVCMDDLDFSFIEMKNVNRAVLPIGWRSDSLAEYVISFSDFTYNQDRYLAQILEADVVVLGGDYTHIVRNRLAAGKLTFIYSERIYKSTRDRLKMPFHYFKFRKKYKYPNLYLLCASAFAYTDYNRIGCFTDKAFKWGYFPMVNTCDRKKNLEAPKQGVSRLKILWVARFLVWKQPELPVMLAERLKTNGFDFELNMYGIGFEQDRIKDLIDNKELNDKVFLRGAVPNEEILRQMSLHDIFLFTSDRNEGWGAVLNEAMGRGCAVIASSSIGSVPFLIEDGINGMIFKSKDLLSLINATKYLFENPTEISRLGQNASNTMRTLWSPEIAATRFIELVKALSRHEAAPFKIGPCSPAERISDSWYNKKPPKHDNTSVQIY